MDNEEINELINMINSLTLAASEKLDFKATANIQMKYFNSLTDVGFSREEALEIIKSNNVMNSMKAG
jgi:hypothetical protein